MFRAGNQRGCSGDSAPLTQSVSALQWRNGLIANGTWTLPMAHLRAGTNTGGDPRQIPQALLCLTPVSLLLDFSESDKISFVPSRNSCLHLFLLSQLLLLCQEVEVYAKTARLGQGSTDLPIFPCCVEMLWPSAGKHFRVLPCNLPAGNCSPKSQNYW